MGSFKRSQPGVQKGRRKNAECGIRRRLEIRRSLAGSRPGGNGGDRGGRGGSGVSMQVNQDNPITSDHIRPNQTKSDQKKRSSPDQGAGRWIKTGADEPRFGSSSLAAGKC